MSKTVSDPVTIEPRKLIEHGSSVVTVIEPKTGWRLVDWEELWDYRDLYYFLVWRGIKTSYTRNVIGVVWAVAGPPLTLVVAAVMSVQFPWIEC